MSYEAWCLTKWIGLEADRKHIVGYSTRAGILYSNMAIGWNGLDTGCRTSNSTRALVFVENN